MCSINMNFQIVLLIGVLGTLVNSQSVVFDTSACTTLDATVNSCVTANSLTGIPTQTTDSVQTFFISLEPSAYCSTANKANFKNLLGCIITAYRACASDEFQKLLAAGDSYKEVVDEVCEHKDDFNPTCTYSSNSCASLKINVDEVPNNTTTYSGQKDFYCGYFKNYKGCLEADAELTNCAQTKTKEVILDIVEKLSPPACGTSAMVLNLSLCIISLITSIFNYKQ